MPRPNPAIESLLADPMVQSVMRADCVEPTELRALLSGVAVKLAIDEDALAPPVRGLPMLLGSSRNGFNMGCGAEMCC